MVVKKDGPQPMVVVVVVQMRMDPRETFDSGGKAKGG
jgi:hypothetical protein